MILINGEEVVFEKFPNNETRMVHESLLNLPEVGIISFKYENDSDLIKLLLLKSYLDEGYVGISESYTLLIYYMPYSRMDRSENNSPFTLKYVSKFINSMNFGKVIVVEPHSDVSIALLNNATPYNMNFKLLPFVLNDISFDHENDYIVFPDVTAHKRYGKFKVKNQLLGIKQRDFETGRINSLDLIGTVHKKGFNALLVDDLCSYGGTFLMTANKLKEMGANDIYLLVTHCEDSIFKGDIFKSETIKKVFTTNTILNNDNHWENAKYKERLKIFDLKEHLKE